MITVEAQLAETSYSGAENFTLKLFPVCVFISLKVMHFRIQSVYVLVPSCGRKTPPSTSLQQNPSFFLSFYAFDGPCSKSVSRKGLILRTPGKHLENLPLFHFQNRSYSKRKEFAPSGSKFFLFRVAPILEEISSFL